MGNPDLIVIFNNIKVFIIKGVDYTNRIEAIQKAMKEWEDYYRALKKEAEKPEEIDWEIESIEAYEI